MMSRRRREYCKELVKAGMLPKEAYELAKQSKAFLNHALWSPFGGLMRNKNVK